MSQKEAPMEALSLKEIYDAKVSQADKERDEVLAPYIKTRDNKINAAKAEMQKAKKAAKDKFEKIQAEAKAEFNARPEINIARHERDVKVAAAWIEFQDAERDKQRVH
jgi:hypothetical protein